MTCARCTCLQEQAVEYSPTSSSATNPSLPSSGTPTAAESCASEPQTDGFRGCTCTRETFGCSIHPNTPAEWIASQRDFLVRILAAQERAQGSMERGAASTAKSSGQLTLFGLDSCSSKTVHRSGQGDGTSSSPTLWRVDTPGAMEYLPRLMSAHLTSGIGGGVLRNWPTPTVEAAHRLADQDSTYWQARITKRLDYAVTAVMRKYPTPTATASKGSSPAALTRKDGKNRATDRLDNAIMASDGGQLNPTWVEWLMCWPLGHTASAHWATAKSRSKPQSRGDCSEARK